MLDSLYSKTVIGLIIILVVSCTMASLGKLTPELVDIIKWVGTAFMAVRVVANGGEAYVEGKNGTGKESGKDS